MRILMLTHRYPYPPDKGDRIRAFYWLKTLSRQHDVDVLALTEDPIPPDHAHQLETLARQVVTVNLNRRTRWGRLAKGFLTGKSLTEAYFSSDQVHEQLRELIDRECYDLCLTVCSSMGQYLSTGAINCPLITDFVDIDSEKWRIYGQRNTGLARWIFRRESRKVAELESRLADASQLSTAVSKRECRHLRKINSAAVTSAIPNGVDTAYFKPLDQVDRLNRLAFVGQMDYFPNVDAVVWFAQTVWPELLRRHPNLRWFIVGRNPTKTVRNLRKIDHVYVTGAVPDVRPFLRSAISIAPIKIACGVQNKVLEAMSTGRPVITTPAVAGGLEVQSQQELLTAESPQEWIAAVDLLLSDLSLARQLSDRARQAVMQRFTWDRIGGHMLQAVQRMENSTVQPPELIEKICS